MPELVTVHVMGIAWPKSALAELKLSVLASVVGYQAFEQVARCPDRYPRRVGIPAKRPLS